ncbi:MAG: [citrate (pro-3S)-lyase] ligase [Synergistaceae bacterium]|nr:[citrate (pro-3S)-lyase] ligase [Synergistaceae bacterium]NLW62454.1 [citrate (pro-3S)-lyase] ligase [Synergistaceae bacterium]
MFGFQTRTIKNLSKNEKEQVERLLERNGLTFEGAPDCTAVVENSLEKVIATASLQGKVIKMVAADAEWQEAGLSGMVISDLLRYARENGIFHLFVYTKCDMADKFAYLGFRELARTETVVLMESGQPSSEDYREILKQNKIFPDKKNIGAAVMNCNPFTNGHRFLIETAAGECDGLYVIIVQEDLSLFPFKDRMMLVEEGTKDLRNVKLIASSDYAVSRATFPTYFLKDKCTASVAETQAELDATLFANLFVPELSIKKRFVGTEPFCPITAKYNEMMKKVLPPRGVEVVEINRLNDPSGTAVSASRVRKAIVENDLDALKRMLPPVTLDYLSSERGRSVVEKLIHEHKQN